MHHFTSQLIHLFFQLLLQQLALCRPCQTLHRCSLTTSHLVPCTSCLPLWDAFWGLNIFTLSHRKLTPWKASVCSFPLIQYLTTSSTFSLLSLKVPRHFYMAFLGKVPWAWAISHMFILGLPLFPLHSPCHPFLLSRTIFSNKEVVY